MPQVALNEKEEAGNLLRGLGGRGVLQTYVKILGIRGLGFLCGFYGASMTGLQGFRVVARAKSVALGLNNCQDAR